MARGFFVVDLHQFDQICLRGGGPEEMAAYLALLKSTDKSNDVTTGGIKSVQEMTGLTRAQSKRAVENLISMGLVLALSPERARAKSVPRYRLPVNEPRKKLGKLEKRVFDVVLAGGQPDTRPEDQAARRALRKGWLERRDGAYVAIEHVNDVAFIPNHFTQVSNGNSPLARVVRAGEVDALRLAVALYARQDLLEHGGVPAEVMRGYYHQQSEARCGNATIHHLKPGRHWIDPVTGKVTEVTRYADAQSFPDVGDLNKALDILERAHVIEWGVFSATGEPVGVHDFKRPDRPLGTRRMGRQVFGGPECAPALMAYLLHLLKRDGGKMDLSVSDFIEKWKKSGPVVAVESKVVQHVEANPPYQLASDGGTRDVPIYQRFVEQAKALQPRYLSMVIPARWMASGLGLSEFRDTMLSDRRIRALHDFPSAMDVFPGVEVKAGVCFFLWDADYQGDCEVTTVRGNETVGPSLRNLGQFDVFVRDGRAMTILQKVIGKDHTSINTILARDKEFGWTSNFDGFHKNEKPEDVELHYIRKMKRGVGYIEREKVTKSSHLIDYWKVMVPQAFNGGDGLPHQIVGKPLIAPSPSVCTQSFLFFYVGSEDEAESILSYYKTRFFRFLVSLRKITQHATHATYTWVPMQSWDQEWTDEKLYSKYGITLDEQDFIASQVKVMEL